MADGAKTTERQVTEFLILEYDNAAWKPVIKRL